MDQHTCIRYRLLDLLLDYDALAQRILQGALGDVLAQAKQLAGNLPLALTQPPLEELPTDDELAEDAALLADDAGALDDASAVHADTRPLQSDARPAAGSTAGGPALRRLVRPAGERA